MTLTTSEPATSTRRLPTPLRPGVAGSLLALCVVGAALADPAMDLRGFSATSVRNHSDLVHARDDGLALGGFDAVSFHDATGPLAGQPAFTLIWKGALWRFATQANLRAFEANPRMYEPRFGGYCAYAMAKGRLSGSSPLTWEIEGGQLFFFHSDRAEALWEGDPAHMIQSADAAWPGVLRK